MDNVPRIVVVTAVIAASWLAFGGHLIALRRPPRDTASRAISLALLGLALAMTAQFAAPWLDHVTGTPNLGRFAGNVAAAVALCGGRLLLHAITGTRVAAGRREIALL